MYICFYICPKKDVQRSAIKHIRKPYRWGSCKTCRKTLYTI